MAETLLAAEPVADPAVAAAADPAVAAAADPAVAAASDNADPAATPEGDKAAGAPAEYADFAAPEGVELSAEQIADFKALAKELNLSQEAAQALVTRNVQDAQKRQEAYDASLEKARTDWADQARADPEFGGDKLTESLATAKKATAAFASPALNQMLEESGLGNHPEVIRLFVKIGKLMSEDKLVTGNGDQQVAKSAAEVLYPTRAA